MNYRQLILMILITLATCATLVHAQPLTFDPNKRLYTSDKVGHSIDKLPILLDRLLANGKPVILFVLGRGNEPEKSLEGGGFVTGLAVHKLEDGYDANVLMFNWDSKRKSGLFNIKDRSRPLSNMSNASQAFAKVLRAISQYRSDKPNSRPIALLVHSMGNIVIETVVKDQNGWIENDGSPLFSNIILSSSDANNQGNSIWVEKISATEKVYVTINANDKVLLKSNNSRPSGMAAVGLEPGTTLANGAVYVDFTGLGKTPGSKKETHEMFGKSKKSMMNQVHVCEFFQQALSGQPVSLNTQNSSEVVTGQRYKLKFKRDATNPCLN